MMTPSKKLRKFIRDLKRISPDGFGWQRERMLRQVHKTINRRAQLKSCLERCEENGQIGVVTMGEDCDGFNYKHESVIERPACLIAYDHEIEESYYWADGPYHSVFHVRPFAIQRKYS